MIRFTVPGRPGHMPKMGKRGITWAQVLHSNGRAHWRTVAACKRKDATAVKAAILEARVERPRYARAHVRFDLYVKPVARRDSDGLQGTIKACLDALVTEGIVEDDSSDCIGDTEIVVHEDKDRAYEYTITVEETP